MGETDFTRILDLLNELGVGYGVEEDEAWKVVRFEAGGSKTVIDFGYAAGLRFDATGKFEFIFVDRK